MIVAERTHAHDFYFAVRFHQQVGLNAESEIDVSRILRINAQTFHAAYFRSSGIANSGARLQPAREL